MYADYLFYTQYGSGMVPEEKFDNLAIRASQHMDYVTFDRIPDHGITERIKLCMCELVDLFFSSSQLAEEDGKIIKSETVNKWKVDYTLPTHLLPNNIRFEMRRICQKWLTRPKNLMYVGVPINAN